MYNIVKKTASLKMEAARFSQIFTLLNAELNPICNLLAFLGAHPILHVSRVRVNGSHPVVFVIGILYSFTARKRQVKFSLSLQQQTPCSTNISAFIVSIT